MILAKYFEKKNIPIFFLRIFQKMCRSIYFRELKQLKKIIQQFSRYGQKKKVDRPSIPSIHPIHPSVNTVGRLLFRIPFLKGPKPRFESSMTLTLEIRFCLILIVEGRIKTYMCNFLVNSSGSRVVVNLPQRTPIQGLRYKYV